MAPARPTPLCRQPFRLLQVMPWGFNPAMQVTPREDNQARQVMRREDNQARQVMRREDNQARQVMPITLLRPARHPRMQMWKPSTPLNRCHQTV